MLYENFSLVGIFNMVSYKWILWAMVPAVSGLSPRTIFSAQQLLRRMHHQPVEPRMIWLEPQVSHGFSLGGNWCDHLVSYPTNRKWVTTLVLNGISGVCPLISGVITHLLGGMNHQAPVLQSCLFTVNIFAIFGGRVARWRAPDIGCLPGWLFHIWNIRPNEK